MSEREKKLLIFLGGTLFIILNLIALNKFYLPKVQTAEAAESTAKKDLQTAQTMLNLAEQFEPQMDWIAESGTTAVSRFSAQSQLQQYLRKQATVRRLDIRDSQILEYQEGQHFGRVKVSFKVTGMERDVVSWLSSIHLVEQRQVITKLEIKPLNNDLTRVEVEVEVEKWIIPADEA